MKIRHLITLILAVVISVFGFILSVDSDKLTGISMIISGALIICAILISEAIIERNEK
jgi:hypothetical protein